MHMLLTSTALSIYLGLHLYDAAADLHALNPYDVPDARVLFDRFLGWANPRPPA